MKSLMVDQRHVTTLVGSALHVEKRVLQSRDIIKTEKLGMFCKIHDVSISRAALNQKKGELRPVDCGARVK
ncbi:hypothetical protein KOR42_53210 [Thalassoglobus neptunius]|uniref:Uncharacterized protein n=1 Tax=Thalassoglobus neptunius TaxID=1938619 RepID=A0A5C5VBD8_9PLAN|nr:hypothetical protein KOR42_53210 [Thalassoglobus neptunius]